jgi:hypothetical protein
MATGGRDGIICISKFPSLPKEQYFDDNHVRLGRSTLPTAPAPASARRFGVNLDPCVWSMPAGRNTARAPRSQADASHRALAQPAGAVQQSATRVRFIHAAAPSQKRSPAASHPQAQHVHEQERVQELTGAMQDERQAWIR